MGERQARGTQTAQQGSDSPGNEPDKNAGRKQGGAAHNEHMYSDVQGCSEATGKWASIYSPCAFGG